MLTLIDARPTPDTTNNDHALQRVDAVTPEAAEAGASSQHVDDGATIDDGATATTAPPTRAA